VIKKRVKTMSVVEAIHYGRMGKYNPKTKSYREYKIAK